MILDRHRNNLAVVLRPKEANESTMSKEKITLKLDELHTPEVEQRLKQQEALTSAAASTQKAASTPSRLPVEQEQTSIWYNAFFNLAVFGLIGGLLAWGCGELVQYFNPNRRAEAIKAVHDSNDLDMKFQEGRLNAKDLQFAQRVIARSKSNNPWFAVMTDQNLTDAEREAKKAVLLKKDELKDFLSDATFYSACGILIALALGMADSIASRNIQGAVVYGGIGALLGLVGGVVVSLFINKFFRAILGAYDPLNNPSMAKQIFARAMSWGILGLFISASPGVVMRNQRKLIFGLIGGLLGGIVGGAMYVPIEQSAGDVWARLVAIVAIGVITGVATALVESVAKQGWLKVSRGLIAGKQFIVYRNPTFIGSSPQCEIYLFRDPKVGRRHAALHIGKAGYTIEDLGTGSGTVINGQSIVREILRGGDIVQIGNTSFTFQEKART